MHVTTRAIAMFVSLETGVPLGCILSRDKRRHVVRARQLTMWLAHSRGASAPTVARALGLDHATVIHACRKVRQLIGVSGWWASLASELSELVAALGRDEPAAVARLRLARDAPLEEQVARCLAFEACNHDIGNIGKTQRGSGAASQVVAIAAAAERPTCRSAP